MKYTFKQFQAEYPDDEACLTQIMKQQYGGTVFECPSCKTADSKFHRMTNRRAYACQNCGHHIYPCAGTIFEKSRTPLTDWFFAMYLMTSTRHGVAAKELQRQIGCTYKTAWRMAHELRKLMAATQIDDGNDKLSGHVEIDETYVGGKTHGRKGMTTYDKVTIMGIVERDGDLRAGVIPDVKRKTLEPIIAENVEIGSTISTDQLGGYKHLSKAGYKHETTNHDIHEYVKGIHHVNTLEGHWSLLKRSIRGTHVHVSPKHMWKYICEFSYRRNMRLSHAGMFNRLVAAFSLPRLQAA